VERVSAGSPGHRVAQRVDALPLAPFWKGLALWLAIVSLGALWCALLGDLDSVFSVAEPLGLTRRGRGAAVSALLIAFVAITSRHIARMSHESWLALLPLTGLAPEAFRELIRDVGRREVRRPWVDLVGAGVGLAVLALSIRSYRWDALLAFSAVSNVVLFVMIAREAADSLATERYARIAGAIRELDLLDTRPLRCFGRRGLQLAFFWAGGSTIASLNALNLEQSAALFVVVTGTLLIAGLALFAPVRAAHGRIRDAKHQELADVRARILAARDAQRAGRPAPELSGWIAYEARIDAVPEWPFDVSTLMRFALLAVIATGSWLGGAVVERLLEAALG
jgi:hypothetical protein